MIMHDLENDILESDAKNEKKWRGGGTSSGSDGYTVDC